MSRQGFERFEATVRNSIGGLQLSQDEAFPNANAVFNWFCLLAAGIEGGQNWDGMSVAGILGNMYLESRLNPETGAGYSAPPWDLSRQAGLVQWNPAQKLADWCYVNGLDHVKLQSQCKRMTYEFQNPLEQWVRAVPISFEDFAFGNYEPKTVDRAAEIFALNYERNAGQDLAARQAYARYWYGQMGAFYELIWPPPWLFSVINNGRRRYTAYE